jgi:hypothetical protein
VRAPRLALRATPRRRAPQPIRLYDDPCYLAQAPKAAPISLRDAGSKWHASRAGGAARGFVTTGGLHDPGWGSVQA